MKLSPKDVILLDRLNKHPELKERVESLLNLTENTQGDVIKVDEAERQTIEVVRQLGNEILHDWANRRIDVSVDQLRKKESGIEGNGKKK